MISAPKLTQDHVTALAGLVTGASTSGGYNPYADRLRDAFARSQPKQKKQAYDPIGLNKFFTELKDIGANPKLSDEVRQKDMGKYLKKRQRNIKRGNALEDYALLTNNMAAYYRADSYLGENERGFASAINLLEKASFYENASTEEKKETLSKDKQTREVPNQEAKEGCAMGFAAGGALAGLLLGVGISAATGGIAALICGVVAAGCAYAAHKDKNKRKAIAKEFNNIPDVTICKDYEAYAGNNAERMSGVKTPDTVPSRDSQAQSSRGK